ncbi:hypothetical protein [Acerihabitans arboris]|uniref:Uncharacterized protein n=1 Tax=Acerihabitans arboris TaxID=2691583 RepID=A0A845SGA7_9GAMM|nr:hypothetical protein [Acerihabitans arboris]NDL64103.1 hypothetical protein [Acerihabitans arboris]
MFDIMYKSNAVLINNPPANQLTDVDKHPGRAAADMANEINYTANNKLAPASVKTVKRPLNKRVALVYGFAYARNFDDRDGIKKFSIDQLNHALGITYKRLNHNKIKKIQRGINVDKIMIKKFLQPTGIKTALAEELLRSWSRYLSENYEFLSIKSRLETKTAKCVQQCRGCLEYTLIKNNILDLYITPTLKNRAMEVFIMFLRKNDAAGFKTIRDGGGKIFHPLDSVVKTIFFRRASKLALKWSSELKIAVMFDASFAHDSAMTPSRTGYRPITFSEYKYSKKNNLDNVFVRSVPNAAV